MKQSYASVSTSIGTIKLRMIGEGHPVLCLHGWPQNHREWLPLANASESSGYRFILPDLPGFGSSCKPLTGYSSNELADVIGELVDSLSVKSFHLVAHDIGGPIAVALAFRRPTQISTLALLETPFWGLSGPDLPDLKAEFWHLKMHGDLDVAMALLQGHEDLYIRHFFNSYSVNPSAIAPDETDAYVQAMLQPGALRGGLMHYVDIPVSEIQLRNYQQTDRISRPILALGGAGVMGDYCFRAAQLIGDEVYGGTIENCGHWVPEEIPEQLSEILRSHWERGEATKP